MKSLLENVDELDELIRLMQRIESRMRTGQFIDAWREGCKVQARLNEAKRVLIKSVEEEKNVK